MTTLDLQRLIWRRLFELGLTADDAARRTRGTLSKEAIQGLVEGRSSAYVSDRVARALARSLGLTEHRVRRAAGLPAAEPALDDTRPHLWLVDGRAPGSD
jgi:hypothetical protein